MPTRYHLITFFFELKYMGSKWSIGVNVQSACLKLSNQALGQIKQLFNSHTPQPVRESCRAINY